MRLQRGHFTERPRSALRTCRPISYCFRGTLRRRAAIGARDAAACHARDHRQYSGLEGSGGQRQLDVPSRALPGIVPDKPLALKVFAIWEGVSTDSYSYGAHTLMASAVSLVAGRITRPRLPHRHDRHARGRGSSLLTERRDAGDAVPKAVDAGALLPIRVSNARQVRTSRRTTDCTTGPPPSTRSPHGALWRRGWCPPWRRPGCRNAAAGWARGGPRAWCGAWPCSPSPGRGSFLRGGSRSVLHLGVGRDDVRQGHPGGRRDGGIEPGPPSQSPA